MRGQLLHAVTPTVTMADEHRTRTVEIRQDGAPRQLAGYHHPPMCTTSGSEQHRGEMPGRHDGGGDRSQTVAVTAGADTREVDPAASQQAVPGRLDAGLEPGADAELGDQAGDAPAGGPHAHAQLPGDRLVLQAG